jgi:hypothetical protein
VYFSEAKGLLKEVNERQKITIIEIISLKKNEEQHKLNQ